jgi:hypothetical protein
MQNNWPQLNKKQVEIMNGINREKLKMLMAEILHEEAENILAETKKIMAELTGKDRLFTIEEVRSAPVETGDRKKPASTRFSSPPTTDTPIQPCNEPLMAKIPSQNQDPPEGGGEVKSGLIETGDRETPAGTHSSPCSHQDTPIQPCSEPLMAKIPSQNQDPPEEGGEVKSGLIETGDRETPAGTHSSLCSHQDTPDQPCSEPLMAKIPSQNQDPPEGGGEDPGSEGLYVYGIAENADAAGPLTTVGIDGQAVYVLPFRDLAAIVHKSPLAPYHSDDQAVMQGWVIAHQKVLEAAAERYGTVIPFGFDTIIMPDGGQSAKEVLLAWIAGEYEGMQKKMAKIRGKKEYGIQVFGSVPTIVGRVTGANETILALKEEMKSTGPGKTYMIQQKIEQELKKGIESEVDVIARTCHRKITAASDDIKIEKIKKIKEKDTRMLLNYSCLVSDEKYPQLGEVLESIQTEEGLTIRFTGPWPVYSFV